MTTEAGRDVLSLSLGMALMIVLAVAFLFSPEGWNIAPLALAGIVIAGIAGRIRALISRRPRPPVHAGPPPLPRPGPGLPGSIGRRLNRAFGPIAAGVIIDLVDIATFGPMGIVLGIPVGGLAGYWMGRSLGLGRKGSLLCALAAGIYCTIPGTELIPLGTLIGACVRFWESGRSRDGGRQD